MTLHPTLLEELLEAEVRVARTRYEHRIRGLDILGTDIICRIDGNLGADALIRLGGRKFDAEPFRVAVVMPDGNIAPQPLWPGSLFHSIHPILGRGFVCIRGTFEYHCHPSHLDDRWDIYRTRLRLPQLLDHLLKKAGR